MSIRHGPWIMKITMNVPSKSPQLPHSPALLHEPQLFRFRLRRLFLLVTALAILLMLLVTTTGPWPVVIAMFTLLMVAHLFAALVGARLRDTSRAIRHWRMLHPHLDSDLPKKTDSSLRLDELKLPPSTTLAESGQTVRWRRWLVLLGASTGGAGGALAIWWHGDPETGLAALAVGTLSFAVLGAWAAFLISSFTVIASHAWRQTHNS
jgi:hypothetical protein